jgi:hypothetical protein
MSEIRIKIAEIKTNRYRVMSHLNAIIEKQFSNPHIPNLPWWGRLFQDDFTQLKKGINLSIDLFKVTADESLSSFERFSVKIDEFMELIQSNKIFTTESECEDLWLELIFPLHAHIQEFFNKDFDDIIKKLDLIERKKLRSKISSVGSNVLYHAVKIEYIKGIIERGSILGYTSHRFWDDGKRHKETDSEYNDSFWMKGISMTRDLHYALSWASVVMVFNKDVMTKSEKIENYSWNYHFKDEAHSKKEREEFVVLSKKKKKFLNEDSPDWMEEYLSVQEPSGSTDPEEIKEYEEFRAKLESKKKKLDSHSLHKPEGEFIFKDSLIGFYIRGSSLDIYGPEDENMAFLLQHPLFLGILDD